MLLTHTILTAIPHNHPMHLYMILSKISTTFFHPRVECVEGDTGHRWGGGFGDEEFDEVGWRALPDGGEEFVEPEVVGDLV